MILSKRLDRAVGDINWRMDFPDAFVDILHRIHSDHCPLLIHCGAPTQRSQNRPFKFMAAWVDHPDFAPLVNNAWRQSEESIQVKLARVRQDAVDFNQNVFGNIFRRKRRIEARLKGVQRELNKNITSDLVQFEKDLQREYRSILKQEELTWFQKARDNRIRLGDRNTAYFHTQAVIRRKKNTVHRLKLEDGSWCSDKTMLGGIAQDYFVNLFARDTNMPQTNLPQVAIPRLSDVAQVLLSHEVEKEEVRSALMSMKSFTAPGPDGFQPFFYKKFWDQVGDDLWHLVKKALAKGKVDEQLLEILVVLIPKVDHPSTIKEFRPISLCNVTFKLVTKVLVNRLRPFLDDIVGPMQSSFLPGRGTMDNAFLAQDIVHFMDRSTTAKGSLAFKIDLEKAYDSISWDFLRETLILYGFPPQIINLIMCCVTSSQLTLLWNGERLQPFKPGRGLRQGDPISPYLFVLCMERFSLLIQQLVDAGSWNPIRLTKDGTPISHMFFADDVLLFCKATPSQVNIVVVALKLFCDSSGLKVNIHKSKAIASKGVRAAVREEITNIAPIPFVSHLGKYLGFPLNGGRV